MLAVLGVVASEALDITGFFLSGKPVHAKKRTTQVNRTNIGRYKLSDYFYFIFERYKLSDYACIPFLSVTVFLIAYTV